MVVIVIAKVNMDHATWHSNYALMYVKFGSRKTLQHMGWFLKSMHITIYTCPELIWPAYI